MKQEKACLVTGAAGFIGSRFVESCQAQGTPVVAVDLKSHFESRPELKRVRFDQVVDRQELFDWLDAEKRELGSIVHLGACANTMETREDFLQQWNVEYSQRLWDYATKVGIPFVYASSAATYGAGEHGYDDDEDRIPLLQPLNAYGRSKQAFDLWALERERKGSAPPSWSGFKFFNVYGYGERHKGAMASVILHAYEQIRSTGKVKLFQSHREGIPHGHQKRDFVAVEDVVEVLQFARTAPLRRGIFNLGTGQARTFLDLAKATFTAMGVKECIEFIPTPASIRDKYQYFTEARMQRLRDAGYSAPFLTLEEGVHNYVRWLNKSDRD